MYILILHGDLKLIVAPLAAVFGLDGPGGLRIVARPDRRKRASKEAGGGKKEPVEMGRLETQDVLAEIRQKHGHFAEEKGSLLMINDGLFFCNTPKDNCVEGRPQANCLKWHSTEDTDMFCFCEL